MFLWHTLSLLTAVLIPSYSQTTIPTESPTEVSTMPSTAPTENICGYDATNSSYICVCDEENQCSGQTITCASDADCTVKCINYESCHKATIICTNDTNCTVECNGGAACYGANIQWPSSGTGTLTCDGFRHACYNVNFPIPPPYQDFTFECDEEDECNKAEIYCPQYANCHIICSAIRSCQDAIIHWSTNDVQSILSCTYASDETECSNTNLPPTTAPTTSLPTSIPSQYPSTIPTMPSSAPSVIPSNSPTLPTGIPTSAMPTTNPTKIPTGSPTANPSAFSDTVCGYDNSTDLTYVCVCDKYEKCVGKDIVCANDANCRVECTEDMSCQHLSITCPSSNNCRVECSEYGSCYGANIEWPLSGTATLICDGRYRACRSVTFPIPPPYQDFTLDCDKAAACERANIYCPEYADCHIICSAMESCKNAYIHWSPNNVESTLSCTVGYDECTGVNLPPTRAPTMPSISPTALPTSVTTIPTASSETPTGSPTIPTGAPTTPIPTGNPSTSPTMPKLAIGNENPTGKPTEAPWLSTTDDREQTTKSTSFELEASNTRSIFIIVSVATLSICVIGCAVLMVVRTKSELDRASEPGHMFANQGDGTSGGPAPCAVEMKRVASVSTPPNMNTDTGEGGNKLIGSSLDEVDSNSSTDTETADLWDKGDGVTKGDMMDTGQVTEKAGEAPIAPEHVDLPEEVSTTDSNSGSLWDKGDVTKGDVTRGDQGHVVNVEKITQNPEEEDDEKKIEIDSDVMTSGDNEKDKHNMNGDREHNDDIITKDE